MCDNVRDGHIYVHGGKPSFNPVKRIPNTNGY